MAEPSLQPSLETLKRLEAEVNSPSRLSMQSYEHQEGVNRDLPWGRQSGQACHLSGTSVMLGCNRLQSIHLM